MTKVKKIKKALNQLIIPWSNLKKIQQNKIVKSTYIWLLILPVAAKVLSKLDNTLTIKFGENTILLDMVLPFSWKVFYVSALLFTIANILFYLKCPKLINENTNFGDFVDQGKNEFHLIACMNERQLSVWKSKVKTIEDNTGGNVNRDDTRQRLSRQQEMVIKLKPEIEKYFWEIFNKCDKENISIRFLISFLYVFAGFLLLIVMMKNLSYVISQF